MSSSALCSFGAALGLLELSSSTGSLPTELAVFLRNSVNQLSNLQDPFNKTITKPISTNSLAKAAAGLSGDELKLVDRVAATFSLDKATAEEVVQAVIKDKLGQVGDQGWDSITAYVFEERMAVIGIVATLLRTSK